MGIYTVRHPEVHPGVYARLLRFVGGYASLLPVGLPTTRFTVGRHCARCALLTVLRVPRGLFWLLFPFHCLARKNLSAPSPVSLLGNKEPSSLPEQGEPWWEQSPPASQNREKEEKRAYSSLPEQAERGKRARPSLPEQAEREEKGPF